MDVPCDDGTGDAPETSEPRDPHRSIKNKPLSSGSVRDEATDGDDLPPPPGKLPRRSRMKDVDAGDDFRSESELPLSSGFSVVSNGSIVMLRSSVLLPPPPTSS